MVDPTDSEAWNAYLAEGNARQARKRVAADVLFRDPEGRILLVDPTYKPDWDVPGGMAEANEPLTADVEESRWADTRVPIRGHEISR
jgi:ADP-ribose pyrophosphatase YjhB (NUDIX family)